MQNSGIFQNGGKQGYTFVYAPLSYPTFGSVIQEMTYTHDTGRYRYGFNGEDKENEIAGEGMLYDLGARFYDGRLGRMFSTDPLEAMYPFWSPYGYCGNNPIYIIDIDGMGTEPDPSSTFTVDDKNGKQGVFGIARQILGSNASETDVANLAGVIIKSNNLRQPDGTVKITQGQVLFVPGFRKVDGLGWVYDKSPMFDEQKKMENLEKEKQKLTDQYLNCLNSFTAPCSTVCHNLNIVKQEINNAIEFQYKRTHLPNPALEMCYIDLDILFLGYGAFGSTAFRSISTTALETTSGNAVRQVGKVLESIEDVFANPTLLKGKTPLEVQMTLGKTPCWQVETLGKGAHKGQGLILREYGKNGPTGRMIQWHPGGGHHGAGSYWKVSSGSGKGRIF